jgi:hypothetical protein
MKKLNFHQYFLPTVIAVSLIAFIFLNTVNVKPSHSVGVKCEQPKLEKTVEDENKDVKDQTPNISLPSIDGVKTLIVLIKKFIPAS